MLGNGPAFDLALFISTIIMDADPEKHPEERFQIMHKAVRFAKQSTNRHEDLGASQIG